MDEPDLPPVCQAPSCREMATIHFMRMTPLCDRHGAKANRRAMVNVLVVGVLFVVVGGVLAAIGDMAHPAIGWATVAAGAFLLLLAPIYRHGAKKLEG